VLRRLAHPGIPVTPHETSGRVRGSRYKFSLWPRITSPPATPSISLTRCHLDCAPSLTTKGYVDSPALPPESYQQWTYAVATEVQFLGGTLLGPPAPGIYTKTHFHLIFTCTTSRFTPMHRNLEPITPTGGARGEKGCKMGQTGGVYLIVRYCAEFWEKRQKLLCIRGQKAGTELLRL